MIVPVEGVHLDLDRGVGRFEFDRGRGVESAHDRAITRANANFVGNKALENVV